MTQPCHETHITTHPIDKHLLTELSLWHDTTVPAGSLSSILHTLVAHGYTTLKLTGAKEKTMSDGIPGDFEGVRNSSDAKHPSTAAGYAPKAWINSNGNTMSNDKYEATRNDKDWKWIIEHDWAEAEPLYTKEQLTGGA